MAKSQGRPRGPRGETAGGQAEARAEARAGECSTEPLRCCGPRLRLLNSSLRETQTLPFDEGEEGQRGPETSPLGSPCGVGEALQFLLCPLSVGERRGVMSGGAVSIFGMAPSLANVSLSFGRLLGQVLGEAGPGCSPRGPAL